MGDRMPAETFRKGTVMFSGEGNNRIMANATGMVYSVRQAAMAAATLINAQNYVGPNQL